MVVVHRAGVCPHLNVVLIFAERFFPLYPTAFPSIRFSDSTSTFGTNYEDRSIAVNNVVGVQLITISRIAMILCVIVIIFMLIVLLINAHIV